MYLSGELTVPIKETDVDDAQHLQFLRKYQHPNKCNHFTQSEKIEDFSRFKKPIVWITSPAGTGKSTFVSSFLKETDQKAYWYTFDESDLDICNLKRNFYNLLGLDQDVYCNDSIENTYSISTIIKQNSIKNKVIVFDNFEALDNNQLICQIVEIFLTELSDTIQFYILSRSTLPKEFLQLDLNGLIEMVEWPF